tara:strand:+ start:573 stop:692 length:120 start_codon:yes stop_codon:yes gene_type:complete
LPKLFNIAEYLDAYMLHAQNGGTEPVLSNYYMDMDMDHS